MKCLGQVSGRDVIGLSIQICGWKSGVWDSKNQQKKIFLEDIIVENEMAETVKGTLTTKI